MKQIIIKGAFITFLLVYCCLAQAQESSATLHFSFDFRNGALGWQPDFADYPPDKNVNDLYELRAGIQPLPAEIGAGTGFFVQGHNRSDDLFMFLKRRLTSADGLVAGQRYEIHYTLTFASNACTYCAGIGGHPGMSVYLKAGASPIEPMAYGPNLRMNVDVGAQSNGGMAASVAGDIANGLSYNPSRQYVSLQRAHRHPTPVTAPSNGELWLLIGTDSGFEGLTQLYYQRIDVRLVPIGSSPPAPTPAPVILDEKNTGRAIALNAATLTREPFTKFTNYNLSDDVRTRITFFATNLELLPGEDASAVWAQIEDAQQRIIQVPVEFVGKVPNFDWLTQIIVRMPPLVLMEEIKFSISLRGSVSNKIPFTYKVQN